MELYAIVADPVVSPENENTYASGLNPPNLEAMFAAHTDTYAVVFIKTIDACPLGGTEPT